MQNKINQVANDILTKIRSQVNKDSYDLLELYIVNNMNSLLQKHNEEIERYKGDKNGSK